MTRKKWFGAAAAITCALAIASVAPVGRAQTAQIAQAADAPSHNVLIDNCDASHAFVGTADYAFKKRGPGALYVSGEYLWFTGNFRPVDTSEIPFERARLEFWFYTEQADRFGEGQIELNSGGRIDDLNEFHWQTSGLSLRKGWNFLSLPLADAVRTGAVDYGVLDFMRIYQYSLTNAPLEAWIDEIRITDTETVVAESELGIPPAPPEIPEPEEAEIRASWTRFLSKMFAETESSHGVGDVYTAVIVFGAVEGALAIGIAVTAVLLVRRKRKGAKK